MAAEGDVGRPGVVLVLEVRQVLEPAQGQEARLGIADRPLDTALGRRPGGPQHDRLGPERPEQARHLVMEAGPRAAARRDDRGVVVEDELLGHAAQALETADQGRAQVAHGPGQGERDGVGRRERQRRDEPERLAGAVAADRHLPPGVPPVDLADLARPVRRPLVCPGGEERRADPGEVVLEDRGSRRGIRRLGGARGSTVARTVGSSASMAAIRSAKGSSREPAAARTYRGGSCRARSHEG